MTDQTEAKPDGSPIGAKPLRFGPWCAFQDSGELIGPNSRERLEPKVMELLLMLASRPNTVCSKEEILQQLWPGMILGDDTLARAVSKLRKALGDDVKAPRYVETLPKRGYRFIHSESGANTSLMRPPQPAPIPNSMGAAAMASAPSHKASLGWRNWRLALPMALLFAVLAMTIGIAWQRSHDAPNIINTEVQLLIDRANDYYFQYARADNEAAIALFEQAIAIDPKNAPAHAGLANAIAQRVLRWPNQGPAKGKSFTQLGDALKSGHMRNAIAQQELLRATTLAEQSVRLAPQDPVALKALGFVKSVREDFSGALRAYQQAITLDANAWGPMINIADLYQINGRAELALPYLESAFDAMTRVYATQSVRIRPWYADTALLIADRHAAEGRLDQSEHWYRKALQIAPFHLKATAQLAATLRASGRAQEAEDLCSRLLRRLGDRLRC